MIGGSLLEGKPPELSDSSSLSECSLELKNAMNGLNPPVDFKGQSSKAEAASWRVKGGVSG